MNIYLFAFVMCVILYFYALAFTNYVVIKQPTVEGFGESTGDYCESCDNLTFGQCMKCFNCGFCGNGYNGKCVNGTIAGPNKLKENVSTVVYDKNNNAEPQCLNYYHNDDFWRYLNVSNNYSNIDVAKPFTT